jgi:hypothetical protein
MKTIYIVTVNGKISSEAYNTLEEAQDFIKGRIDYNGGWSTKPYYMVVEDNKNKYEIHDVTVKS